MATELTAEQESATRAFIDVVNGLRLGVGIGSGLGPGSGQHTSISKSTAVKFLAARKWDVQRAIVLYETHEATRRREGLFNFDPNTEPLQSELATGKFTVLASRDPSGAAIAVFTARAHNPLLSTHQITLQGVVYQLDVALESIETQRCGLVFIYDMSGSKYSNFDYDLSQKILTLLKGAYPAKLKKVLIVTAPLWFKAPFKILRLFVREKLRDRVFTISFPQLSVHIPREALPTKLGGTLEVDHAAWLLHCHRSMTNREHHGDCAQSTPAVNVNVNVLNTSHPDSLATAFCIAGATGMDAGGGGTASVEAAEALSNGLLSPIESPVARSTNGIKKQSVRRDDDNEEDHEISNATQNIGWQHSCANGEASSPAPPPSSASSGFSDDDSLHCDLSGGYSIEEFVEHVSSRGRGGLVSEYVEIKARELEGSFNHAKMRPNLPKNRYTDVLCFDHSRVLLSQVDGDTCSDYINANFVDGYKQKNAFISTQGPLPKTSSDFWRMIWEQQVLVIVMTTKVIERGRTKCGQYWPTDEVDASTLTFGNMQVTATGVENLSDYTITTLTLTNLKTEESRQVSHFQYTSWPDYGVPHSAMAMLDFLARVRAQQALLVALLGDTWAGHPKGPPIVVHCSAGIGRTGTFCTLDICINRLEDLGTVDVRGTVERIRTQRAFSIQMPDQYVFCHLALIEYAFSKGLVSQVDLSSFATSKEDDSD